MRELIFMGIGICIGLVISDRNAKIQALEKQIEKQKKASQ